MWLMEFYCFEALVLVFGRVYGESSAGLRHGLSRGDGGESL